MADRGPRFTDLMQTLPDSVPFVGPETQERARNAPFGARLGANESAFGPSPLAVAAMERTARDVWMYGDPEAHELKLAIAAHHGVATAQVVVGEGIDGLLGLLARMLLAGGDAAVTSDGAYPTFNYHVAGHGGVLHRVPYRDDHEDPTGLIDRARATGAKLIYFANPDNPMGTWHAAAVVERMIAAVPDGCLLVLDEAYVDLAPSGTAPRIDPADPRVIRLRTFSKGYGLAGLRVGYGIGAAPLVAAFDKVRSHFGVGRLAQAGAIAALADQPWLVQVQAMVADARATISTMARANGLLPLASATNFVTVDCRGGADLARLTLAGLIGRGVFLRMPAVPPLDRCIRVGAGSPADLALLAQELPAAVAFARRETAQSAR